MAGAKRLDTRPDGREITIRLSDLVLSVAVCLKTLAMTYRAYWRNSGLCGMEY